MKKEQIRGKRKKYTAFLTGVLAFAMTVSYFSVPNKFLNNDIYVEAAGETKTFNNTGTGATGADVNNSIGTLGGNVTMSGGIYYWTVPYTGEYEIQAIGANRFGGTLKGASMKGEFTLNQGNVVKILVGQTGTSANAGSGGTFVVTNDNSALIVAGGAGQTTAASTSSNGQSVSIGYASYSGYTSGCTGNYSATGGSGGSGGNYTNSGAGFTGNGASGAKSFTNGGAGHGSGGFGGGGNTSYGGGGGYSGGAGYRTATVCTETHDGTGWVHAGDVSRTNGGGGGGSYNSGANPINAMRTDIDNNNHGQVTIKYLSPTAKMSPVNGTKFQNSFIDVNWTGDVNSDATITKYEIQAGTTPGGTNIVPLTDKGLSASQRISISVGTPGNTTIYWRVRATDSKGRVGPWVEQTVIYSNNVPTITATPNAPVNLDVSLEKRNHGFKINSLKDSDDFNYVTLFADVLDKNGVVITGSKKQIVLDSSLVSSAQLISDATEKNGSLQGPVNHTTPFDLKLSLQPDFTNGTFDLTLTKADGVTNVIKSGAKLLTSRAMQASSATNAENYTLRIYPEDRQNTNTLAASPLAGVNDVDAITIPFTSDTRNYLPNITNLKDDVASRVFSEAEGFNRISVTGHVDDSDPADVVTMYYEVQPKADNYAIQVTTTGGKVVPRYGKAAGTFQPKVDNDFAFTYQIGSDLDSGDYALLVYGYDSQEGIGDYVEIPFTVNRDGPTIDFVANYTTPSGQTIAMSSAQKQIVAEDNKVKLYFTPNNYATFEYAGYLVRAGVVKDLRIRGAFTNEVNATFIGVDLGKDPITLLNGEQTDFKLRDVLVFKFKATSATGIVTQKDVRILIGNDQSTFAPINDANIPNIP